MRQKPAYEELDIFLFDRFPALRGEYEKLLTSRTLSGMYAIYLNVFYPFLLATLGAGDEPLVRDIFEFVENLATDRKERVQQLIADAVLELLVEDPGPLSLAWPHLGEASRRIVEAIAEASGRTSSLPSDA